MMYTEKKSNWFYSQLVRLSQSESLG